MKKYLAYMNRVGNVAEVITVYDPAWQDVEIHVPNGLFWEGDIPQPNPPTGYSWTRWIKLNDSPDEDSVIYYTYYKQPDPPETQLEKATARITVLESADLDNKEMIATLYELTIDGKNSVLDKTQFAKAYVNLFKADRLEEENVPPDLREEYDRLKAETEKKEA